MGRHSISLVVFCLMFGFLLGLAGFLSMAYLGGFVEPEEAEAAPVLQQYATATERLEKYRCRAAETKMIIMGGTEDGFDPAGEELTTLSKSVKHYLAKAGAVATMSYDDPAQNRFFSDAFDIPTRTFHGIIALRMEERSRLKNDNTSFGFMDSREHKVSNRVYSSSVSKLLETWQKGTNYIWEDLDSLHVWNFEESDQAADKVTGLSHLTLLDAIRANNGRQFEVQVADDTIVDFIGFALCLEPEVHKGSVFKKAHYTGVGSTYDFGPDFISLYSSSQGYDGNTLCSEKRPLPCIDDQNLKAPDVFSEFTHQLWSGGYIKFTEPVAGIQFKTEEEVDAFCAAEFGADYRGLNKKDGNWQGAMVGYGDYPVGYDEYWVTYKDSPHHNCWSLRSDYEDVARLKAEK